MATHDERLASFEPRKPESQKKSAVNTAILKGWPHPKSFKARPSTLAHAGFYFDPTSKKNDNVTCFMGEHSLGEWTQYDDPFVEHLNVAPKCPWAIARCNIELDRQKDGSFRFTSAARLPTSKGMEKARADTFKGYWIHDKVKGHSANSKKMAKGGWIFNPGEAEDSDLVTCFYCGKNLDGWEQGDDPTHQHKRRVPTCPFFTGVLEEEEEEEEAAPDPPAPVSTTSSKSRTKPTAKRGKNQARETAIASDVNDTAAESDAPSQLKRGRSKQPSAASSSIQEVEPTPKAPAASTAKPAGKASKRGTSRSTSVSRKAADDVVDLTRSDSEEVKAPSKKGKAPKVSESVSSRHDTHDRKPSKNRDVSVAASAVDDEEVPVKPSGNKKKTKKKGSKQSKVTVSEDGDTHESEIMEVDAPPPVIDLDATPVPSDTHSVSDWNKELEEQARELHIEEEFAALDNKRQQSKSTSSSVKAKPVAKVPLKSGNIEKAAKAMSNDRWAYREQSVDARSAVTDLTEEEEVEKSLAEDDYDDEDEEDMPSPPPSRPASMAPSIAPSATASTTVSSKTKVKVKEIKSSKKVNTVPKDPRHLVLQQDEDMADMSTPKAKSRGYRDVDTQSARPPLPLPAASFDSEARKAESISSGPSLNRSNPFLAGNAGNALQSMAHRLDGPVIGPTTSSYDLTPEEREMTLEEWIKFNIERQREEIRKEGRKWIEEYLEHANETREKIRAL